MDNRHVPAQVYLGIDGGASKVAACLVDETGAVLATARVEAGANYHALPLPEVVDHLVEVVQEVLKLSGLPAPVVVNRSVFGLAGCNFAEDSQKLGRSLRQSALVSLIGADLQVVNDSWLGLRAGTPDGIGVVVVAGTGSNCFGRNRQGAEARSGGMDYILADEGSGYDIGLRLLKAVTRSLDGRMGKTLMKDLLFEQLTVGSLAELHTVVYSDYQEKSAIASLAPVVITAAEGGDQAAQDILIHSVNQLIRMVDAVLGRLSMQQEAVAVVETGSIFQEHQYFSDRFADELRRIAPQAWVVRPMMSSAEAAAWLAKEGGGE